MKHLGYSRQRLGESVVEFPVARAGDDRLIFGRKHLLLGAGSQELVDFIVRKHASGRMSVPASLRPARAGD